MNSKMGTPLRLTSQVSEDAAPMTPHDRESTDFPYASPYGAMAEIGAPGHNQEQQIQKQAIDQHTQSNAGQGRPADLQLQHGKIRQSQEDLEEEEVNEMPSAAWENEIKQFLDKMPDKLKIDNFDVLIVFADNEEDEKGAEYFRNLIIKIDIGKQRKVTAFLYNSPELEGLSGSKIGHFTAAVKKSTYVFMYLTEHFVTDEWMTFCRDACLTSAIYDKGKEWSVVPIYTQRRESCSFDIPMEILRLKGINYYNNDTRYRESVAKLITENVSQREFKDEQLKIERKQCLEEYKRTQLDLQAKQRWITKDEITACMKKSMTHSHSENPLRSTRHPIPHTISADSLKDIHTLNRYSTSLQEDRSLIDKLIPNPETTHTSAQRPGGTFRNAPPLRTSVDDYGGQSYMAQAPAMPVPQWTFGEKPGNQRNMVPELNIPGNQLYYPTQMHRYAGTRVEVTANCNKQEDNLPVVLSLTSLEQDCGYFRSNTASSNTTVGNQNMGQNSTGVEPNSGDASDDEREGVPVNVIETTCSSREQEIMERLNRTHYLKKDQAEGDIDYQGTMAVTEDQQQPTQGACNVDAALSAESGPVINYEMEHPIQHGTKQKSIIQDNSSAAALDDPVTTIYETTRPPPEGMDNVEESSFKDKTTKATQLKELKEVVQCDQTNIKSLITECRTLNCLDPQSQTYKETKQLLRKSSHDCDREQHHSNIVTTDNSASANVSHEIPCDYRETFSIQRQTDPSHLFYHAWNRSSVKSNDQGGQSDGSTPAAQLFSGTRTGDPDNENDVLD